MFTLFTFPTVPTKATARRPSPLPRGPATWSVVAILAAASFLTLSPVSAQVSQQFSQQTGFIDPPGRVARMNLAEGPVSFAPADTGAAPRWTPALLNRPLTTGDRLWTGQRARSELHIGSTAVRLGEQTSLDFLLLDDDTSQLRLAQGTMKLRVRKLYDDQRIEINTPNLAFVITQPGDYRVDVSGANPATTSATYASAGTTRVVVQQGAGTIYGDGGAQVFITSGQQANFTDTQLTPAGPAPEVQDGFDAWAHQRDRLEDQSVSARYIPREVIGYQQLDTYGDWSQDPTYGAVWLPRAVPVNWAPYRAGHWSWIAPWGWTWVDDAPWGFAPFHYGRWAQIGPRWGWVPGQLAARPVYAPALVAFIGGNAGGVNWNVSIGQQAARPGLGWFPLAPGEVFRPAYQHSPRYITNVNQNIVVTNINVTNNYRYQQRGDAVSAMSADDFARGQRVRPEGQRLNPADLGRAQVLEPERGGLPQRLPGVVGLRDLPPVASPAALPPAAVTVRPVVASQLQPAGQRDDRRDERPNDPRQNDPQGNARVGRPAEGPRQQPRPGQPVQIIPPALPRQGAAPDRGAFEAEQRARAEQQRQQGELARQQQDRAGVQRPPADESLGQRALREQALRNGNGNGNPNPVALPVQPGRPDAGRDPIEQAQREQQRLQRDQQRQQVDAARQQEQQRRQADESLGQRAMQEQAGRQQQAQRQLQEQQQAQQRAQQEQQRQARDQQQQLQRQQQDQARQATQQQAAQLQAQRQQAQEQQAQQRAQQDQARQQQTGQQQQLQLQQRAQQEQQRQARDQPQQQQQPQLRQQPDQPREAGRERQPPRRADAPNGGLPRIDERGNRQRD